MIRAVAIWPFFILPASSGDLFEKPLRLAKHLELHPFCLCRCLSFKLQFSHGSMPACYSLWRDISGEGGTYRQKESFFVHVKCKVDTDSKRISDFR